MSNVASNFDNQGLLMRIWKKSLLWLLLASPIPALIYCLCAAYTHHQYKVRARPRCISLRRPPNFAISVSEATSVPNSSKNVWIFGILLHVYPRILQANAVFKMFKSHLQQHGDMFQNSFLYTWTYIDW